MAPVRSSFVFPTSAFLLLLAFTLSLLGWSWRSRGHLSGNQAISWSIVVVVLHSGRTSLVGVLIVDVRVLSDVGGTKLVGQLGLMHWVGFPLLLHECIILRVDLLAVFLFAFVHDALDAVGSA